MGSSRIAAALLCAALLSACAFRGSVQSIAVADNQAIARARDEVLVQNILRATAREPLMFSTVSQVQTSFGGGISLDNTFSNLIAGGKDAVETGLGLSGNSSPIVTVSPLASKEFTDGVLQPLGADKYGFLVNQGWDPEFLLPMIVASVRCPGSRAAILNSGKAGDAQAAQLRDALSASAADITITPGPVAPPRTFRLALANDKAADVLQKGLGAGYEIGEIRVDEKKGRTTIEVSTVPEKKYVIAGLNLGGLCPAGAGAKAFAVTASTQAAPEAGGAVTFRSVEGIIYFLGETFRDCYLDQRQDCTLRSGTETLFALRPGRPDREAAVTTTFHGRPYWIPAHNRAEEHDRTLKTLSLLDLLIGLQIEPSSLATTPAVLSIGR